MTPIEIGMFAATVVLVLVTIGATGINYFFFRANVDPEVVVFADSDKARPTIIVLRIKNIGRGVAYNVRFNLSESIPAKAWGVSAERAKPAKTMTAGPLITGIPSLGPGAERMITWGQFGGLVQSLGDRVVRVTAFYESRGRHAYNPSDHVTESLIDVHSFHATDDTDPDGARQAARELKKISRDLGHIASGFRSLRVRLETEDDHENGDPDGLG